MNTDNTSYKSHVTCHKSQEIRRGGGKVWDPVKPGIPVLILHIIYEMICKIRGTASRSLQDSVNFFKGQTQGSAPTNRVFLLSTIDY